MGGWIDGRCKDEWRGKSKTRKERGGKILSCQGATGGNLALWLMSVIREQVFHGLAVFQEQPIRNHYPRVNLFPLDQWRPFVSPQCCWTLYWKGFSCVVGGG